MSRVHQHCEFSPPTERLATCCRAAAAFFYNKDGPVSVAYISDAYRLLSPAVGTVAAKIIFGIALLASGQNSTITGTLSGGRTRQPEACTALCCLRRDYLTCKALVAHLRLLICVWV